jgi:hypothetical protein
LEGRGLFFVYPSVRRVIKEQFIPVTRSALHSSGYASDDQFWNKLAKQGVYLGNNIGIMCTADGKWLGDKDISKALSAWRKLPASERRPGAVQIEDRGPFDPARGVEPPPGGLILRGFLRDLKHDSKGQLYAPRKRSEIMSGGTRYQIMEEPNRDYLWLTAAEWKSLVPEDPKKGDRFALPSTIQERFLRFHLVDGTKGLSGPWQAEHIRTAEITLVVTEVSPALVRLRLEGIAVMMNKPDRTQAEGTADVRLLGYLDYDKKASKFSRFDILALGPFRTSRKEEGVQGRKDVRVTLGFAFELVPGDASTHFVPPRGTRLETGSSRSLDEYFRGAPGLIRAIGSN